MRNNDNFFTTSAHCSRDVGIQTTSIGHSIDKVVMTLQLENKSQRDEKILQRRFKRRDIPINNINDVIKMLRRGHVSNAGLEQLL